MSEKTFKVGDRVRVINEDLNKFLGKTGLVRSVRDNGYRLSVNIDGEAIDRIFCAPSLEREEQSQPPRLPQVGEVWRMRNGEVVPMPLWHYEGSPNFPRHRLQAQWPNGEADRVWLPDGRRFSDGPSDFDLVELVSEAQQPAEASVVEPQVKEAPQKRLPQVGEVWKTRNGCLVTEQLCRNPAAQHYIWYARCSDGEVRTWTADGTYHELSPCGGLDLVELVSEAQPEPQPEPATELEVSVEIVPLVSVEDKKTGVSIYHDEERDIQIDLGLNHKPINLVAQSLDAILSLSQCLAKLHEVLSKEAAK